MGTPDVTAFPTHQSREGRPTPRAADPVGR